jgi:bifunctional DNA-binding transcriptional regulator/antitoxin component of YhaV-PrlF toxin-antitoxin module
MGATNTYRLTFDSKRRTTWPAQLLAEAGLSPSDELVAHRDAEGRIVVETRAAIKRRIHDRAADGRRRVHYDGNAADELLAERRTDRSLA